jgi:arylsulfatase A-like enzyme
LTRVSLSETARRPAPGIVGLFLLVLASCDATPTPSPAPGIPWLEDMNVLLVVLDTVGVEHVGTYRPEIGNTPTLDRLAREGTRFDRAYATAPWTQPSVASILTGRLPSGHGLERLGQALDASVPTLAMQLSSRGFGTAAIVSNNLLLPHFGFGRGFDVFRVAANDDPTALTSARATRRALRWLTSRRSEDPFFLLVHYFDPHYAYRHHPAYDRTSGYTGPLRPDMDIWELRAQRDALTAADVDYLVGLHREEIAHTDAELGRLLDAVDAKAAERPTLVIVTADHGEEFLRHGWLGHTRTLYEELLRVPLVIRLPGAPGGRVVDAPVSLVDFASTLLALSRDPSPPLGSGRSLLPFLLGDAALPEGERPVFAEVGFVYEPELEPPEAEEKTAHKTAVIQGSGKLIHDLATGAFEYYNVKSDPDELAPLDPNAPDAQRLRGRLSAWERTRTTGAPVAPVVPIDASERQRLRALGYLQ